MICGSGATMTRPMTDEPMTKEEFLTEFETVANRMISKIMIEFTRRVGEMLAEIEDTRHRYDGVLSAADLEELDDLTDEIETALREKVVEEGRLSAKIAAMFHRARERNCHEINGRLFRVYPAG